MKMGPGTPTVVPHPRLSPTWLLAALVAAGCCAIVLAPGLLPALGILDYGHWFLDSYIILAANDAVAAGLNPFDPIPFDRLGRGHVYSEWWLELGRLGLTRADNFLFGSVCVLGFITVGIASVRPRSFPQAAWTALLMLSPPFLFAVNRANNDLVIFIVIGIPLLLLCGPPASWKTLLLAGALIIATGLKYYPIVALVSLALLVRPTQRGLWLAGGAGAIALLVLWSERAAMARGVFPFPDSIYLFGAPIIWRDLNLGGATTLLLSTTAIALAAAWLVRHQLTVGLGDPTRGTEGDRWMFAVGALILTGCFLAGTSFAYRWIFALWLCPWLWSLRVQGRHPTLAKIALGLLLLNVWLDGLYCLVLNLWIQYLPQHLPTAWRYATQTLNWILIALLAGWLLDAARRQGHSPPVAPALPPRPILYR